MSDKPFMPINLSEIAGCFCLVVAFFLGMVPGGSGEGIPYWIAYSFPFFILGVLWRIHYWQVYAICKKPDEDK